jgi:hypothetical protein
MHSRTGVAKPGKGWLTYLSDEPTRRQTESSLLACCDRWRRFRFSLAVGSVPKRIYNAAFICSALLIWTVQICFEIRVAALFSTDSHFSPLFHSLSIIFTHLDVYSTVWISNAQHVDTCPLLDSHG